MEQTKQVVKDWEEALPILLPHKKKFPARVAAKMLTDFAGGTKVIWDEFSDDGTVRFSSRRVAKGFEITVSPNEKGA